MHRTVYDQDHEAFRASVREFAERTLKPRHEEMLHAKGITLFVVEEGMPGFQHGRRLDKVGQNEADTAELFFTDVRIPDASDLGL